MAKRIMTIVESNKKSHEAVAIPTPIKVKKLKNTMGCLE